MKIKILEYKAERGNKAKVQSHNKRNGKWIVNKRYEDWKQLISINPTKFLWHKEYEVERL